jgi:Family of unknown function (DUF6521)
MASDLSPENRRLLNPAFAGALIVRASQGFEREAKGGMPYVYAYLILPLVLHPETRERLPNAIVTRLPTWAERNGDLIPSVSRRAGDFAPATKDGIFLVTTTGLATINDKGRIAPTTKEKGFVEFEKVSASHEVASCFHKAQFVGRWLATSGTAPTVMTVLGVEL